MRQDSGFEEGQDEPDQVEQTEQYFDIFSLAALLNIKILLTSIIIIMRNKV